MINEAQKLYPEMISWFQDLDLPERIQLAEFLVDLLEDLKDEWVAEEAKNFCVCNPDCNCHE